jgi:hypothetical protein
MKPHNLFQTVTTLGNKIPHRSIEPLTEWVR